MAKIFFIGGTDTVTGSAFLLDLEKIKILIDFGQEQGQESNPKSFKKKVKDLPPVDYVFLTHAHIDHSGLIPALVKHQKLRGQIFSTPATRDLSRLLLEDSLRIAREEGNVLFEEEDLERTFLSWKVRDDGITFSPENGIEVTFFYNSHIIGSISVYLETSFGSFLFSGDIGTRAQRLMDYPPQVPNETDFLFLESTYGQSEHRPEDREAFLETVSRVLGEEGRVLIPVFAVGRLQEVLHVLKPLSGRAKIYVDTPLGNRVTQLTDKYVFYLKKKFRKSFEDLFPEYEVISTHSQSREKAEEIFKRKESCIVLSASGMCEGGRILHYLPLFLKDRHSAIVFVGYQAEGTRGRRILDGQEEAFCKVFKFSSFSAHADRQELLKYVDLFPYLPRRIFLVHGEEETRRNLSELIKKKKIKVYLPKRGEVFQLRGGIVEARTGIFIEGFRPQNFVQVVGRDVIPVVGFLEKTEDGKFIFREKGWLEGLLAEEERVLISRLKQEEIEKGSVEEATEEKFVDLNVDSWEALRNAWKDLYNEEDTGAGVVTKARIKDFWNKLQKGPKTAISYITETTRKKRWNRPPDVQDEEELEALFSLAYETFAFLISEFKEGKKAEVYAFLKKYNPNI